MKQLRLISIGIFSLGVITLLSGCKKDEDTTAPTINLVRVNGEEVNEAELEAGTTMVVLVEVSDDENLNQIKVNVHSVGDDHSHEGEEEEEEEVFSIGTWSENVVSNLAGESEVLEYSFDVPGDILGFWHLEVQCLDEEGNEAEPVIVTLHVENPEFPVIDITSTVPELNGEGVLEVSPGGSIDIFGTASDDDGLSEIHFELANESDQEIDSWAFDPAGANSWELSQADIVIPQSVEIGSHLHLHIHVQDNDGFENVKEIEIHVE